MSQRKEHVFRSAPMALVQFYLAGELGREVVDVFGRTGFVEFRDLNDGQPSFQRSFVDELKRIEGVSRVIAVLEQQIKAADVVSSELPENICQNKLETETELRELFQSIQSVHTRTKHFKDTQDSMNVTRTRLLEHRHVLLAFARLFETTSARRRHSLQEDDQPLLDTETTGTSDDNDIVQQDLGYLGLQSENTDAMIGFCVAGVIERKKYSAFEQICWRVSRGNICMTRCSIDNQPDSLRDVDVFVIYVHGKMIHSRVTKVAESLDSHIFQVSNDSAIRSRELQRINTQLAEVDRVLDIVRADLTTELEVVGEQICVWKAQLARERAVYETLNMFNYDINRRCLIAEGWIIRDNIPAIQHALRDITDSANVSTPLVVHEIQTTRVPPTFHETNKFTKAFQNIVDVYGVATYREVNPALPTIVTFPFMFAIMFGDVGHGLILSMAAFYLVLNENALSKTKRDEVFDMAFSGRYVLLLMGIFSMYIGFLYNDIFSQAMTFLSSGWTWPNEIIAGNTSTATFTGHTYIFGIDWRWHASENSLLFLNSYKMKLSILMGYLHMTYSLCFQLMNALFAASWIDIIGNFIPSMIFMQSIFGYLSITIVYKWCINWIKIEKTPPGLLNMLIDMFLAPTNVNAQLYAGQRNVQNILVILAVLCVPVLLLLKPLYLRRKHRKFTHRWDTIPSDDVEAAGLFDLSEIESESNMVIVDNAITTGNFEFSEILIHQIIHTIEFCLNCVSHTASYLRLWALSLAHNQLSSVLWKMTIQIAFRFTGVKGIIATVCLFCLWFMGTVTVLVCMEGTSAMLHSLRLHWVEAMSKHFEGEGYAFNPFAFKTLLV